MPLVSFSRQFLDVDVPDRTPGVKQQARWETLLAKQDATSGVLSVQVGLQTLQFAEAEGGTYGERLVGQGIAPWPVVLVANNDCAVDPDTGEVKYLRTTETEAEWLELLTSKPEPLLLQGDWFLAYMQQGISLLLRQFMEAAKHPPFSKWG